jgi:FAD/FMN-containing dehydrogenase
LAAVIAAILAAAGILFSMRAFHPRASRHIPGPLRQIAQRLLQVSRDALVCLSPRLLLLGLAAGLLAWSLESVELSVLLDSLGHPIPVSSSVSIYAFSMLAGAVSFLPGGLGSSEACMVLLLRAAGIPLPTAVSATLIVRAATLWFAVLLGALALAVALMPSQLQSWGGLRSQVAGVLEPSFSCELAAAVQADGSRSPTRRLVVGNLRSYGDEVVNDDGWYVRTVRCDRIMAFEPHAGLITVESGARLDALQLFLEPRGYGLPVTPGTALVTVGGAIANDVHGKNHHRAGTFGCFVDQFELVRTTGERLLCAADRNPEWFAATIGGMGLTGAITWATLRLRPLGSPWLATNARRFGNLDEFFSMEAENSSHEYAVAWIDCLAPRGSLGRGIYSVGDHVEEPALAPRAELATVRSRGLPFELPLSPVNSTTIRLFNHIYFRRHPLGHSRVPYRSWLYPLDSIAHWNRIYGRRGFYQLQCVVPRSAARVAIAEMLQSCADAGQGSFLAVLKNFGAARSPGLMSFPMEGTTLALDFPNRGERTRELMGRLYDITEAAAGRLYPAKDGCSPDRSLERGYPGFAAFKRFIDPGIGSRMARRLRLID